MVDKFEVENGEQETRSGGVNLSQNVIAILILVSVIFIFVVGILSGFVFRKINACEPIYNPDAQIGGTTASPPGTSSSSSTTTTSSSSTTRTTTTTASTSTSTAPPGSSSSSTTTTTTSSSSSSSSSSTTRTTTTTTSTSITDQQSTGRTVPTLSTLTPGTTPNPNQQIYDNIRLPDYFEPTYYNLKIRVNFDPDARTTRDSTWFDGEVDIYFNLKQNAREILFHAHEQLEVLDPITITNLDTNQETQTLNTIHRPVVNDYFYINLTSALNQGRYKMRVNYRGLAKSLYGSRGMFARKYLDDEVERTLVATSFAPNEARKVFPCFDEPQLRATFDITIEHPLRSFALSNAEVLSTQTINNQFGTSSSYIQTKFKTTPKMNTASLGWAILPDMYTYEEVQSNGVPIRLYAKSFAKKQGLLQHGLNVAKGSLEFFRTFLQNTEAVPSKIDLVAVGDYPYESMEVWGLAMFREAAVLYSPTQDSAATKQSTAVTVAEEIAHLWFGNLVSCSWWDDLWFNKGAAAFLKYKAIDSLFADWEINNQFIVEETVPVMWEDGYASSHPLKTKLKTTADIISVSDKIASSKGAAVFRTVESVVGAANLQAALRNYLSQSKASGVGNIASFISALTLPPIMSGTSAELFVRSWTEQMNYPIIEIQMSYQGANTVFNVEQDRFLLTVYDEEVNPIYTSPFNYIWQVLVRCKAGGVYNATGDEQQHNQGSVDDVTFFLSTAKASQTITNRRYSWIKCNQDFSSYYTSSYSKNIIEGQIGLLEINPTKFSAGDRANLLHVTYQLAFRGDYSYSYPASLSSYLAYREKHYVPWKVFDYHIGVIASLLEHRPVFKQLAIFAESIAESIAPELDIYEETAAQKTHLNTLLAGTTLDFLCRLQEENCLNKATELYYKIPEIYFDIPNEINNPLHPNVRAAAYKYHLQNTYNYNDWFDVFQLAEVSGDAQEKEQAINGATASRSTWILNLYLDELLNSETHIRKQDFFQVMANIARNPSGRHLVWYFYRHYWDDILAIFTNVDYDFGQSIKAISETFADKFFLEEMWDFFASHPNAGSSTFSRLQAIDVAENNVFWIFEKEQDIANNLFGPLKKI